MMPKATVLLVIICLGCPFVAAGQAAVIRGTVADSARGVALSGARVTALTVLGAPLTTALTDARGSFRLSGLAPGRYDVVIGRIGYRERRVTAVAADTATVAIRVYLSAVPLGLDPIVITPSASPQTELDAPASVSVVERAEIEQVTAFTPVDRIGGVTGVDFASKGLMQHTFAVRGDRGANSGALLFLTDHRLAAVPSIGFNVPYLIPLTSDDIARIEVTRGPGAAIYGPDSDRGVVHVITRSPFDSRGATLSLTGGERSLVQGSMRYAATPGSRLGFKVSAEYFRGDDWEYTDPAETEPRDYGIRRAGGEAQVEWRPARNTALVGTLGLTQAISNIDLAPDVGAVQVRDWRYGYAQWRLHRGSLLANVQYNWSDAGQSYRLRSGAPLVDQSRLLAGLVQHAAAIGPAVVLYGIDARWTDPRTGETIHGRNEYDDRVTETGAYVHATTPLAPAVTLVTALRVDHHDRIDDVAVSPRLGLVFRARPTHAFRLTYNRGFNSPDPSDLFVDIEIIQLPGYAVRVGRVPRSGYTFRRDCGGLCMRSPFPPGDPAPYLPADATLLWPVVVEVLGRPPYSIDITDIPAPNASQVATQLGALNLQTQGFDPIAPAEVTDFGAPRRTLTNAVELGYKGVIANGVRIQVDAYRNRVTDPLGELVATPNVFHERESLEQYLMCCRSPATAAALADAIAQIPLGSITPEQSIDTTDILLLRRQGGAYTLWGADVGVEVRITRRLTLAGSYSWVSEDSIPNVVTVGDVVLSIPRNKGALSVRYADAASGFAARLEGRAVSSFPVVSGVYSGRVDSYALVDVGVGFPIPRASRLRATFDAYNVFDARHREYVGAPELGRLLVARLQVRL